MGYHFLSNWIVWYHCFYLAVRCRVSRFWLNQPRLAGVRIQRSELYRTSSRRSATQTNRANLDGKWYRPPFLRGSESRAVCICAVDAKTPDTVDGPMASPFAPLNLSLQDAVELKDLGNVFVRQLVESYERYLHDDQEQIDTHQGQRYQCSFIDTSRAARLKALAARRGPCYRF